MIIVIQRVVKAEVKINNKLYSSISRGVLIFIGVCQDDTEEDVVKLADKIPLIRIMADKNDKMNLAVGESDCEALVISQFTLCSELAKGRRPSFTKAMEPTVAQHLYELFANRLKKHIRTVRTGSFGSRMQVSLVNDGPVTFILDSKQF